MKQGGASPLRGKPEEVFGKRRNRKIFLPILFGGGKMVHKIKAKNGSGNGETATGHGKQKGIGNQKKVKNGSFKRQNRRKR